MNSLAGSPTNVDEITVILPQVNSNWVIDADEINFIEKIGEGTAAKGIPITHR